jgi:hypothetical protein
MEQDQTATLIVSPFPDVGEMPVSWCLGQENNLAKNHKAIVDLKTGRLFSIVSKDYRLIRHEEATGLDPDGFPIISVWEFYNLLTWHITYNAVSLNHRVEMESRLRAASINLMR